MSRPPADSPRSPAEEPRSPAGAPPPGARSPGRRSLAPRRSVPARLRFAWAACIGLLGVLTLGWLTGLRGVMHALLITLGSVALVPLSLVLGSVALVAAASLVISLIADDTALARPGPSSPPARASGGRWLHLYQSFLERRRESPLALGLAAGLALGLFGLWLVLAALVLPLETRTLGILRLAQARLASLPAASPPAADGLLHPSGWSGSKGETGAADSGAGPDGPVLDAFGHPIAHVAAGGAGGFTLRSLGLDGVASRDDLCASGRAGLSPADASGLLRFVEDLRADRLGWSERLRALGEARCRPPGD